MRSYLDEHPEFLTEAAGMVKVLDVNEASLKMFAADSKAELLGSLDKVFVPETLSILREELIAIAEGQTYFEGETINRTLGDENLNILLTMTIPAQAEKFGSVLVSMTDISARVQAEKTLLENERRFRALIENSQDVITLLDAGGNYVYDSPAVSRVMGYAPEERVGRSLSEFVHPDERQAFEERFEAFVQQPGAVGSSRGRFRHKDGSWRVIEGIRTNLIAEPSIQAVVVNYRDITGRVRAEAALQESEVRYRALFEQAAMPIVIVDPETGRFVDFNAAAHVDYGYTRDEFAALSLPDIDSTETTEDVERRIEGLMRDGDAAFEVQHRRKDGELREVFVSAKVVSIPEKPLIQAIWHDITERKKRERELLVLSMISGSLRRAATRAEMLPVILDQILDLVDVPGAALAMRDPLSGDTVIELGHGLWGGMTSQRIPPQQGICGLVIATGQPYHSEDVRQDEHFYLPDLVAGLHAVACVPLIAQEQTIGALWVGRQTAISEAEISLLTAIADMAANAIQRATLYEQTQMRFHRLAALRSIDLAISASMDLRLILNIVLDQTIAQLNVDAACVLLPGPAGSTLDYAVGRGFRTEALQHTQLRPGTGYAGQALLEKRVVHIPDLHARTTDFLRSPHFAAEAFIAYFAVPLTAKGQARGVLEIFHRAPLEPDAEWLDFLDALAGQAAIAIDNATLFGDLQKSNTDLILAYDKTLEGWAKALELRDKETEGHSRRVTEMTLQMARAMGFSEAEIAHVRRGALLHDIGKMGIPDSILHKPGPLTDEEWAIMRQHPLYACNMLTPIEYLRPALDIPCYHHEKWDGTGYPQGLKGEQIPLAARIFAVVDVWDALRSERPYREAWPEEEVLEYIDDQAGSHFDPQVVEAFLHLAREGF